MKTFILTALLFCAITTRATNYYFSAISGDDSRTTLQAQNPATPWKTLSKLNSFFSTLNPGDSVLLKRNETFYGSITTTKSGVSGNPIVIGSYGKGNKPVITSLVTLDNWVSKGNGIYESYNSAIDASLNMVLLNGAEQQIGRYPNTDAPIGGYLYFESHSGTTSITDNELTSSTNWTGAEVVIRQRRWILDRDTILSHSGTTITHTAISGTPYDHYGYFIQNHIKTLDKLGEWYFNPSTKKLSVYFGAYSPSSYLIQATTLTDLIYTYKSAYIVFDNLTVKGANANGFNIYAGSNVSIKNCDVLFSGANGIKVWARHNDFQIEGSIVSNSNNNGIDLGYGTNAVIRNNKIINTSLFGGMGASGDGNGIALNRVGDYSIVEFNEIRNTGYNGLTFAGDYVTVKNNYIDSFCIVKDDGAGIYTYGGTANISRTGRKIIGNIVSNGVGAGNGTDNVKQQSAHGIYIDGNASGVEISNNTVLNSNRGLYLHSCREIVTKNNTFYNNLVQIYMLQESYLAPLRDNVINNNIAFSKIPSQPALSVITNANDIGLFGT
ncbi:MAG: right-handed parallel beta-helix repeat-containing protein, partial [Ginsengibacter sp.]